MNEPTPTRRVLVADDEPHMTYILSLKLQKAGIEVLTAQDGEEAYALACQRRLDLVISDFQMPRMSGIELAKRLRANASTARTPVVIVTARGHRIPPEELAQTNIQQVLAKPFSMRELLAIVERFLGGAQAGDSEAEAA